MSWRNYSGTPPVSGEARSQKIQAVSFLSWVKKVRWHPFYPRMRVLFYLPIVTPWWFETIITPLIRIMAAEAEVHVLVPTLWRNTGIGPTQLAACTDLTHVHWHLMDGEESKTFRISAANCPELLEFVNQIDADYTFCRSADFETPARFPGIVRYVMEGAIPPFPTRGIVLTPQPFDHGYLPELATADRERLAAAISPAWHRLHERFGREAPSREAALAALGLPLDKHIVFLPLEYEHHENFFRAHNALKLNSDLVLDVASRLGPDEFLVLTDHPLNERYVDSTKVHEVVATLGDRAALLPNPTVEGDTTNQILKVCDGVIVELSKIYAAAGFFGTPTLRRSPFRTGEWLRSFDDFDVFMTSLRKGERLGATPDDAHVWFGFHLANELVDPRLADVKATEIIERMQQPVDPRRWDVCLERYRQHAPELFA